MTSATGAPPGGPPGTFAAMSSTDGWGPGTIAVHGAGGGGATGPLSTPVLRTSTFRFETTAELVEASKGGRPGFYTRYGHPNFEAVEKTFAALHGADLGSTGIYQEGLTAERLSQQEETVHAAVRAYLRDAGAGERYADIRVAVEVDAAGRSVTVRLEAPLHLPLTIPGSPANPVVRASSTAAVTVVGGTS